MKDLVRRRRWPLVVGALLALVMSLDPGSTVAERSPEPAAVDGRRVLARAGLGTSATLARAAQDASDGFRVESSTRFTLDPDAGVVHVVYEATVTNELPPRYGTYSTAYSYLPRFVVPLVSEAVNVVAARQDGSALPVAVETTDLAFLAAADIDLIPDLQYRDSAAFRLTYDLPPVSARTAGIVRLNPAFATFPVFAIGDPGLASVEVVIPDRYDVELIGSSLERAERDGLQVFTAAAIAEPATFDVSVVARDDDQLVTRTVDVGAHETRVLGWPGDDPWVDFVAEQVERGVPELSSLLGLDWPATRDLDIIETVSPYIYGYAGWAMDDGSLIEVGDELDQHVILHELSHLWFNDRLYRSRWINEALADEYAAQAVAALGATPHAPNPVDGANPGAVRLNEWSTPHLRVGLSLEQEAYGYNASWSVLHAIIDEIGLDRLSAVVRASEARELPYGADGDDRRLKTVHGWRQLLDLLTDHGGSTTAEPLFRAHVVTAEEAIELDARAIARADFSALQQDGRGWAPPAPVRDAMSRWRFKHAEQLMEQTRPLLGLIDGVAADLDELGIELPETVRTAYERSDSLAELEAYLDRFSAAVHAYQATAAAHADARGPLRTVGLAFAGTDEHLDGARADLRAGDLAGATRHTRQVTALLEGSTRSGLARLAAFACLLGAAVLLRRARPRAALAQVTWRLPRRGRTVATDERSDLPA